MDISSLAMNDWNSVRQQTDIKRLENANTSDEAKLKQTCDDFETIFVKMMLDSMRKTVPKNDLMGKQNTGEEIFEDMLYDKYAAQMSAQADLGISRMLYSQLSASV